jgi:LmbE family N-acetylglucosaminyl deacetylase
MAFVNRQRLITGDGTPERQWRGWLGAANILMRPLAQLLPSHARLVVVAPHPDDEVLACGGLIAGHSLGAGETLVVAVSDGEASHAGTAGWNAAVLARKRRAEHAQGLRRLSGQDLEVLRLGLPDGQVARHAGPLRRTLMSLLVPSDVVVCTWQLDGHPDHDATGAATAQACLSSGCRLLQAPVWMWHWASPGDARVPWHRLLGMPLESWAVARKQRAIAAHSTQLLERDAHTGPVLGPAILARAMRSTEYFFV